MRKFKVKIGDSNVFIINKDNFERETKQASPFYTKNEHNEEKNYAVCPACDNPIQILGLYKELKNTPYPYGKHFKGNIANLAQYNQQAYDFCPYSKNQINVNQKARKQSVTEYKINI